MIGYAAPHLIETISGRRVPRATVVYIDDI
jgi:hypothetical protein